MGFLLASSLTLTCPHSTAAGFASLSLDFRLHLEPLKPQVFTQDSPDPHVKPLNSRTDLALCRKREEAGTELLEKHPKLLHLETLLALIALAHYPGTRVATSLAGCPHRKLED